MQLNALIKLLCRIVRVNWLSVHSIRNIYLDVVGNVKEDIISSLMMPFPIFTELIYQFQSFDLPPKHKTRKLILDFKETTLLPIFEYCVQVIKALFDHEIKTEKLDDMFLFIDKVIRCLMECLEYEDDLNAKENFYSRYEIKPSYIPNNKKRQRDKTLDIELIASLFQSLFDTHNLMIKSGTKCNSDQCLLLLQKLIAMKIIYLGDRRYLILKSYQSGISDILINKKGLFYHEQLCKLIYNSKKNYSVNDLLINDQYWNHVFTFTNETINEHFIDCLNGVNYLLRYYAYISFGIERIPYSLKSILKNFIESILNTIINKRKDVILISDEDQLNDLITSFGLCGYCIYEILLQRINDSFDYNNNALENSLLLRYGVALMKAKYLLFSEGKMVNKSTETDSMIDSIRLTELIPTDVSVTVSFILNGFSFLKTFQSNQSTVYAINVSALSLIKLFALYFLNQHLPNKFLYLYQQIVQLLQLNSTGEIIIVIIDALVHFCQQGAIELKKTIKIIQIIESNCIMEYDSNCNKPKVQLGKIQLTFEFVPHIQRLINVVVSIDPKAKGKIRKLLLSSLFNLYSMIITYDEALCQFLSQFNYDKLSNNDTEVLFAINSLSALITAVKQKKNYEVLIEKIVPLIEVFASCFIRQSIPNDIVIHLLKLFRDLTHNSYCRITFRPNSDCPYKLFRLAKELLNHYYSIAKASSLTTANELYMHQIKPIALFSRIFDNLFNGDFIQISVIVNAEPGPVQILFKQIIELVLSLSHEDVFGYINKLKGIYSIIKIIYSDYPKCAEVNESIIKSILILFNEGIDSCDKEIIDNVYGSIYELGLAYLPLMRIKNKTSKEYFTFPNRELLMIVFDKYASEMRSLLLKLFQILLNNEFDFIEAMAKTVLVLGLIYNEYYAKMSIGLVEDSQLTTEEKNTMNEAFAALFSNACSSDNVRFEFLLKMFYEDLKKFAEKIKDIYNNHCNTN